MSLLVPGDFTVGLSPATRTVQAGTSAVYTVITNGQGTLNLAATGLPADTSPDVLVEKMVGRKVERLYPERAVGTDRVVLEARDLKRLPDVRGVSPTWA